MSTVVLRSPLAPAAFCGALLGAWPNATTATRGAANTVEVSHAASFSAAPALSVALFTSEAESLWPIELELELRELESGRVLLSERLRTQDGQRTTFDESFEVPTGVRELTLGVTPRHHVGERIELDWRLELRDAGFEALDWKDYALHRVNLGPRPATETPTVRAVRADLSEVDREGMSARIELAGVAYALEMRATRSSR